MKLKHLFLTFSFVVGVFSVCFAQQQQTALNVTTTSTSDTLDFAGREQAHFTTDIINTTPNGLFIDNMQLQIPDGFELFSLELKKNGVILVRDSTSMYLNDTLQSSEAYTLDYDIRLSCNAIPTNISNQFSILHSNNLQINYAKQDSICHDNFPTNSYRFLIPNLYMTVGKSTVNTNYNIKEIQWQTPIIDTISIRNTIGAGSISNLRVSMLLMQNIDAFSEIKFKIASQEYEPTYASGMYSIDLTSSDFRNAGLEDSFDGGEDLKILVFFKPTKFYLQTQVKYIAKVQNGFENCNEQTNASAICDYQCVNPNVILHAEAEVQQKANYCGEEFICNVTVSNISENILTNTLKNARLRFGNSGYQITSVEYNGTEMKELSPRIYRLPITDIDGDSIPDLLPQESFTFQVKAIIPTPTDNVNISIYLIGETIDGTYQEVGDIFSSSLTKRQFSLLSPTDSRSGDTATYHIDVDLNAQRYFETNGFIDAEYISLMYNDSIIKVDNQGRIGYNKDIDIIASCDKPQLFKLAVKTNECDVLYIVDSIVGNTVVECPDTLFNSSCIYVHTTEVLPITPQKINTCETFSIDAVGELSYLSNDTCSHPQRIIARVYDLDGQLKFESVACSVSVNGSSYSLQKISENTVNNGIVWASELLSFPYAESLNLVPLQLTAEVFIKGDHSLPNVSNCNIRVEFAIEDDENRIHNANSKGSILLVYDPQFRDNSSTQFPFEVESPIHIALTTTPAASSVKEHPIHLLHVELPAVDGFYYTTPSEVGQSYEVDLDSVGYSIDSSSSTIWGRFFPNVHALCATDGTPYNDSLHGTYTYSDYYASCDENETFSHDFFYMHPINAPVIEMDSSMEQGLTTYTTWNVFVKNTGNAKAPNVTLRIKPSENNVTDLNIAFITVNDTVISRPKYQKRGNVAYINIGDISKNQNDIVKVTVTMSGCVDEGISYLDVTAIWSCEDIMTTDNIPEEFELRNCNNFSTRLALENMKAELSASEVFPTQKYKLCEEIPIHVDLYNSGRASLSDVGFIICEDFFSSNNVILTNDAVDVSYQNHLFRINDSFIGNITTTNDLLSSTVLFLTDSILPSRNTDADIVSMDFSVMVECDSNVVISPLIFKTSAITNCGQPQEKTFVYNLPIDGLDKIQMLEITTSSTQFIATQSEGIAEGQLMVTVTNNSSTEPLGNIIIKVKLPDGLTIDETRSDFQDFSLRMLSNYNETTDIELIAPSGYEIPINESRLFTLTLQENKHCPTSKSIALVSASIPVKVASNCGTDSCVVRAQTISDSVELQRLRQPVIVTITGADTVCVGNEVTLTASGADSYQWSTGSTNAITEVTYPTTTYHVTGTTSDGCSGEAEHTITFVERLTQPQLVLVVGSDTVTNGKIQYSDWSTLGEQIIHPITDTEGILTQINQPNDGGCGTYEYQYTITTQCDSLAASITFEVENCDTTTCEDGDLVVIEGKPGYTLEDLDVLRGYVQNGATLQPASDGGFTITLQTNCGETTYTLNGCFINNADINKDGVVNNADIDRLAELILEQTNCQNNQNF